MTTLLKTLIVLLAVSFTYTVQATEQGIAQQEITEGKIQASILNQAMDAQVRSAELISNIQFVQDMVGSSLEDSDGLLKALGEKEFFASIEKQKIDAIILKMESVPTEGSLVDGLRRVQAHLAIIVQLNREARALIK